MKTYLKIGFIIIFCACLSQDSFAQSAMSRSRQSAIDEDLDYIQRNLDKFVAKPTPSPIKLTKSSSQNFQVEEQYVPPKYKTDLKPVIDNSDKKLKYTNEYLNVQLQVLGGYRKDRLDWNIAGDENGQNPNILSELTWKDIEMSQIGAKARIVMMNYFVADARGTYADIYSGKNQDSDYLGDERTFEFSQSQNDAKDGEAMDVGGSFGFRFPLKPDDGILEADNVWVTLLGGYSRHEQHFIMEDAVQTILNDGPFEGLNSRYTAEWKGPFVGLEFEAKQNKLTGFIRGEYHWVDYHGEGNWNLREEFSHPRSFEHIAKGSGIVLNLGGGYHITDWWLVNLEGTIQRWTTDPGIDRTFFFDDLFSIETRLNEVTWNSYSVMLGTTLAFF